jgi:AraC family transcriptional regulator
MEPRLVDRPAFRVVGMTGRFTAATTSGIPALWGRFAPRMASVPGRVGRESYGVCQAERGGRPGEGSFDYTAGVAVELSAPVPAGMVAIDVPANRYAVFTHTGSIAGIGRTMDDIWQRWLPASGLRVADGPDFEVYDDRWDPATASGPVDVYVPVHRG